MPFRPTHPRAFLSEPTQLSQSINLTAERSTGRLCSFRSLTTVCYSKNNHSLWKSTRGGRQGTTDSRATKVMIGSSRPVSGSPTRRAREKHDDRGQRKARSLSPTSMSRLPGSPGCKVKFLTRQQDVLPAAKVETHTLDVESPSAILQRKVRAAETSGCEVEKIELGLGSIWGNSDTGSSDW